MSVNPTKADHDLAYALLARSTFIGRAEIFAEMIAAYRAASLEPVRADLTAFFALLDLEEDSELTGKLFHPTRITSCRALDGQRIDELLGRLKAFATSTP